MSWKSPLLPLTVAAALAAAPAVAAPSVLTNTTYYEVTALTGPELIREMGRLGPADDDEPGERYWAQARWRVQWNFNVDEAGGSCGVTSAVLTVRLDLTYPRWTNIADGPDYLRDHWNGPFMAATRKHELQHARHGTDAAEAIEAMLLGHERMASCDALIEAANQKAYAIIDEAQQNDVDYDAATRHGYLEGITIPTIPVVRPGEGAAGAGRSGDQRVGIGLSPR